MPGTIPSITRDYEVTFRIFKIFKKLFLIDRETEAQRSYASFLGSQSQDQTQAA